MIYVTLLFFNSNNIIRIYTDDGFTYYFCNQKSAKPENGYQFSKSKTILQSTDLFNIERDGHLYAKFLLEDKKFLAEYDTPITKESYEYIKQASLEKFDSIKKKVWPWY